MPIDSIEMARKIHQKRIRAKTKKKLGKNVKTNVLSWKIKMASSSPIKRCNENCSSVVRYQQYWIVITHVSNL